MIAEKRKKALGRKKPHDKGNPRGRTHRRRPSAARLSVNRPAQARFL